MEISDFNQLVSSTKLSKDSREAARMVFVENARQVDVAEKLGMSTQRMNQIVKTVKNAMEKKEQTMVSASDLISTSFAVVVKQARDQFGDDARISVVDGDKSYVGPIVARTDFHVVQSLGRDALVVHEIAKLDRVPAMGEKAGIKYEKGRGVVQDRALERDRGGITR